MAGIEMTHIPYRGSGPATADLLSGQVTVGFLDCGHAAADQGRKLRALAVTALSVTRVAADSNGGAKPASRATT